MFSSTLVTMLNAWFNLNECVTKAVVKHILKNSHSVTIRQLLSCDPTLFIPTVGLYLLADNFTAFSYLDRAEPHTVFITWDNFLHFYKHLDNTITFYYYASFFGIKNSETHFTNSNLLTLDILCIFIYNAKPCPPFDLCSSGDIEVGCSFYLKGPLSNRITKTELWYNPRSTVKICSVPSAVTNLFMYINAYKETQSWEVMSIF